MPNKDFPKSWEDVNHSSHRARMMLPKEPINCSIRQSIITTQRVVLSMKYILEMFHPGRGSLNCINSWCSVSHNYFSCCSGKELKRPICDSHLEKWVLLRATEPVFICTGISPKEIRRDLVIRMSITGSFTTGKKCKQLKMSNNRLIFFKNRVHPY